MTGPGHVDPDALLAGIIEATDLDLEPEARVVVIRQLLAEPESVDDLYSALGEALTSHDDDCAYRCLRSECGGDHGCAACADDGLVLIAGVLYDGETLEVVAS